MLEAQLREHRRATRTFRTRRPPRRCTRRHAAPSSRPSLRALLCMPRRRWRHGAGGPGSAGGSPGQAAFRRGRTAVRRTVARPDTAPARRRTRSGIAGCSGGSGTARVTGKIVRPAGDADTRIRPDVHAGAPPGVGDQLANREVLRDIGQRSAARAFRRGRPWRPRSAGCPDSVRVVAEQQCRVELIDRPLPPPPDVVSAVVEKPLGAQQQAGVVGVVLQQQAGRRLQDVDALTGCPCSAPSSRYPAGESRWR